MTGSSDHQPRAWPAFAVLVASAVGIGTLLIRARPNGETAYLPGAWVELMGLTLMGFVLLSWKDSRTRKIAVGVSSVLAAQLAGSAVYAFKRWVPIGGFGGGVKNIVVVRVSATAMAVTMVIAGSACLALLIREGAIPATLPRSIRRSIRALDVAIGVGLACVLPWVLGAGGSATTDLTSIGAYVILYSAPFGGAMIATAWFGEALALAVLGTIAVSAALVIPWQPTMNVVEIHNATAGFIVVAIATGLAGLVRILGGRGGDASLLDSPRPTAPP